LLTISDFIFSEEGASFVALKEYLLHAPSQINTTLIDQFFHEVFKIEKVCSTNQNEYQY
jgi:hypothetical protein